ncbi:SAT1 [Branchiostoma lanceolatum]|uniref:SAT1 protein n=1 Tax=Branchiostoma lanceolatum TaxID=7740 RepID=A0A8J9Z9R9_BRALA|nr:SAT1 [Branchiostoma lanceolatum]
MLNAYRLDTLSHSNNLHLTYSFQIYVAALREDAFRDDPYFRALVAEVPGTVVTPSGEAAKLVGYAMYYFCYSPFVRRVMYLEDFYVETSYRGRGIGTSLMKEVAKIGVENNCNKMQWVCLNWNDVAIKFYKKHGGKDVTVEENWHLFRMDREELISFTKP